LLKNETLKLLEDYCMYLSTIHNNRERYVHNYEKQLKESACRQYFKIIYQSQPLWGETLDENP